MNKNTILPILGIIAGDGDLPEEVARLYHSSGGESYIASVVLDRKFDDDLPYQNFPIGSVGSILGYFKENSVENIIIIGGINRPDLKSLKVDFGGSILLAKILKQKMLGDDNVLRIIADHIGSKGFKVVSPKDVLKLNTGREDFSNTTLPSKQDQVDIEIGKNVIEALGKMDVGQSVIVSDGYVVGIEAAEGTDNLIERCAKLRKNKKGGVLVKMSKSGQDMRFDIPAIGERTVRLLAEHNFSGIAIEKCGVIVIKSQKVQKIVEDKGMFFYSIF